MVKEKYTIRDTCVWTIMAPRGSKINITFTAFKILQNIRWLRFHPDDYDDHDVDEYKESLLSSFWYNHGRKFK